MGFTNSPLAKIVAISPNRTSPRNQPITKITVHHMAGVLSAQDFCNIVARPSREMSANYGIGYDGTIALTCPEGDRSWCSSSPWNDHRAITIEVSNSASGGDWPIGTVAYNALIDLCVDICKRNNIPKLVFTGDRNGSLTFHYMFAATACPGPWMKAHAQDLCNKVNARLGSSPTTPLGLYTVSLTTGTPIYDIDTMKKTGEINASTKYTITQEKTIDGTKYGKLKSGAGWVILSKPEPSVPSKPGTSYTVKLNASDLLYESAGGRTIGSVGANGVFTIVEDKTVGSEVFGKLKSGAGWVVTKRLEAPKPTSWWSGKYDPQIKELQQILNVGGAGLVVDGVAGDKTFIACKKYTVVSGDTGNLIRWVQKRLGVSADGYAGQQTMNAIYAFQKKNGLGVGYLGGDDWKYLIR